MRVRIAPILALFVTSLPASAQWEWGRPHPPKTGACFYKDHDFMGDYFCMKVGDRWPALPAGFNDKITSIRLFRKARVLVYNNNNFEGVSIRINHSVSDLHRFAVEDNPSKNWNDRISSIAVFREHAEREGYD